MSSMGFLEAHKNRITEDGAMNFAPDPKLTFSDHISALIDHHLVEKKRAEYKAGRGSGAGDVAYYRIGAGYIGVECARQLAYRFHKVDKDDVERHPNAPNPGELQRHAESGFWTEDKTAEWMRWAGFDLWTHKDDGSQFGFKAAFNERLGQYQLAGEVDGIITGLPGEVPEGLPRTIGESLNKIALPCIWESKKATDKKFKEFQRKGVKGADPKYYGQIQTAMAYMSAKHGKPFENVLFSMLNLNTMRYFWELVPFDAPVAQRLSDRAVQVMGTLLPEEMPRITNDPSDFRCRFCDYRETCWQPQKKVIDTD